jgi:hypothetical protein
MDVTLPKQSLRRKPILKRGRSELTPWRLPPASSLVKQTEAPTWTQHSEEIQNYALITQSIWPGARSSHLPLASSSNISSEVLDPNLGTKRVVLFDEEVAQSMALWIGLDENGEFEPSSSSLDCDFDSDSDDGIIIIKQHDSEQISTSMITKRKRELKFSAENRTIALLPSTSLKFGADDTRHIQGLGYGNESWCHLSETLKLVEPSMKMLPRDDKDDSSNMDWQPPNTFATRRGNTNAASGPSESLGESTQIEKTPSGMPTLNGDRENDENDETEVSCSSSAYFPNGLATPLLDSMSDAAGLSLDDERNESESIPSRANQLNASSKAGPISAVSDSERANRDEDVAVSISRQCRHILSGQNMAVKEGPGASAQSSSFCQIGTRDEVSFPPPFSFSIYSGKNDNITDVTASEDEISTGYYSSESDESRNSNNTCRKFSNMPEKDPENYGTLIAPVIDPMRQALMSRIMEEFWVIFNQDWDPGSKECAGASSSPSSMPGNAAGPAFRSPLPFNQRKRQRQDEPPDGDNRGNNGPPESTGPCNTPMDSTRLACPFRKHDTLRYSIHTHRMCALSYWKTIARVK